MSDIATLANGLNLSEAQLNQLISNVQTLQSEKLLELAEDVARTKEGSVITAKGLDLLARAVAGGTLVFTKIKFGDALKNGVIQNPTEAEQINFTKLINAREMTLPITGCTAYGNGVAVLKFLVNNAELENGFWCRELGVFAKIDGDSKEILYAYKNTGALSSYIPAGGGATALDLRVSVVTVIDQAANVVANIDTSAISISEADFEAHINSLSPHPNVPNKKSEVTTSDYFWATGSDNNLRPISKENLSAQILGGDMNKISTLSNRINQTEINIANLYMQLDAEKQLGLDANLLVFEDFIDCAATDTFKIKVADEAAGARNVCVDSVEGILEGHFYTISDGVRSQYVKVTSIAKNDNLFVIFFEDNLAYTFDLKKTYLYRTTCDISAGAKGAGDFQETILNFSSDKWQGESSSSAQVLTLATTQKNAAKFTLTGDAAFTNDGFFTLSA